MGGGGCGCGGLGADWPTAGAATLLLEAVLGALASGGPSAGTSAEALQRLLGEVFSFSMAEFR